MCFYKVLFILFSISFVVLSEKNQLMSEKQKNHYAFLTEIMKINEKISILSKNIDDINNCNLCASVNQSIAHRNKENEDINHVKAKLGNIEQQLKVHSKRFDDMITSFNQTFEDLTNKSQFLEKILNQTKCGQIGHEKTQCVNAYDGPAKLYNLSSKSLVYTFQIQINETDPKSKYESEVFPLVQYGMDGQAKLVLTTPKKSLLYFRFKKAHPSATWSLNSYPRVTYLLKDHSHNEQKKHVILSNDFINFGNSFGFDKYEYLMGLNSYTEAIYNRNGSVAIEVHLSWPAEAKAVQSSHGSVNGVIEDYHQLVKWRGVIWRVFSPYFYTGPRGYRAVLGFRFNDFKSDSEWFSVKVYLLTGENDALLSANFNLQVSFTLFNQFDSDKNLLQVQEVLGTSVDLTFKVPENFSEFVLNDKLLYEAVVKIYYVEVMKSTV